jgi:hypothetical protein
MNDYEVSERGIKFCLMKSVVEVRDICDTTKAACFAIHQIPSLKGTCLPQKNPVLCGSVTDRFNLLSTGRKG